MGKNPPTRARSESSVVEDYLETIKDLIDSKGYARGVDIAEGLGISQASVSNMMQRLDEKGLIKYEKYRGVTLTAEGEQLAHHIATRHEILQEFLDLLGIDEETSYADVEGMEHHISEGTLLGIQQIIQELKDDPEIRNRVIHAASLATEA